MTGERQLAHLHQLMQDYPQLTQLTDELRALRGHQLDWPDWCFLPMSAAYGIISAQLRVPQIPLDRVPDIARIAALNPWRYTRGIYRFHPRLAATLNAATVDGDLPVEVFLRLPEWGIYVELPEPVGGLAGAVLHGFYAHLEHDTNTGRAELRILLDEDQGLHATLLHIGPWSLIEAVDRTVQEALQQARIHHAPAPGFDLGPATIDLTNRLTGLVSLLLYLCSDAAEMRTPARPGARPGRPRPTKTKRGWRLFQPKTVTVWDVGADIGPQLSNSSEGYWHGATEGDRYRYRWITDTGGGV